MTTTTGIQDAEQQIAAQEANRMVYWFDVPKKLAAASGVSRIGFHENTAGEELMATDRARGDQVRLGMELVKQSLRFIDNTKLNMGDGSMDTFWGRKDPASSKIRQLCLAAYQKIHNPSGEEAEDFLGSMSMEVG